MLSQSLKIKENEKLNVLTCKTRRTYNAALPIELLGLVPKIRLELITRGSSCKRRFADSSINGDPMES